MVNLAREKNDICAQTSRYSKTHNRKIVNFGLICAVVRGGPFRQLNHLPNLERASMHVLNHRQIISLVEQSRSDRTPFGFTFSNMTEKQLEKMMLSLRTKLEEINN